MIRVVACDLGGVLFTEGKEVVYQVLSTDHGYDPARLAAVLTAPRSMELRVGQIDDETFWQWAAEQLPSHYNTSLIKKQWYDSYLPNYDVCDLLRKLRGHCRLIAFSGNIKSRIDYLDSKYDFRRLFDDEVYSFDHGVNKPSPEFVAAMVRTASVTPAEIAYIDDKERDAAAAVALGVNVFIYQQESKATLERWLTDLIGKPL